MATHTQSESFLKCKDIQSKLSTSRASIYRWMKSGTFPRPIQLGSNMVRWKESDINAWISSKEKFSSQSK